MKTSLVLGLFLGAVMAGQSAQELIDAAAEALKGGQTAEALKLLDKAIAADDKNARAYALRAEAREGAGRFKEAVADYSKVIALDDKDASIYHQRGCAFFKMGKFKESIADFDKYIELKPDAKVSHWQRGISYYYAGQFDEGRKQFEGYQDFDSNDVENAVWRYMCMARLDGADKAPKAMLKIGNDKRVPMRQVYELYSGKLKPEDVLAKAKAGEPTPGKLNSQLFYAHLYIGIYYDLEGNKKKALEHLQAATNDHRIGHYMWDVARVHRDLLKKELEKK